MNSSSTLIKDIHEKVVEVKQSKEMEVEYMTLFQRDRENREMGRDEGRIEGIEFTLKVLKLHRKGMDSQIIAEELSVPIDTVNDVIQKAENL